MGFASGLPLMLTGDTLAYRLARADLDTVAIGAFALVGLPYALKLAWAPMMDRLPAPLGMARLGRRRGWLLATQLALAAALAGLGVADPEGSLGFVAVLAIAVAFLSASQDIVVDAYRIERLERAEQGAGAAAAQIGYRVAMLLAGAGALALSEQLPWPAVYACMAALMVLAAAVTLGAREPLAAAVPAGPIPGRRAASWRALLVEPVRDLTARRGWGLVLAFALLYKLGDAMTIQMATPCLVDLGFDGMELASARKLPALIATALGALAGGWLVARRGLFVALLAGGVLQAVTNLLFALLALRGHDMTMLVVAVVGDGVTGGLGSAAFIAYLSALCSARHTAAQYALLTSVMAIGRTVFAAGGGLLAARTDWPGFWVATTALAAPGLVMLPWLRAVAPPGVPLAGLERR